MKKHKDTERSIDSIGININPHLSFGRHAPSSLTPIMTHQASPEEILDNIEKKA